MSNLIFEGVATALITPTSEKGVDFEKLEKLINWQIDEGINALVICGTTGEGSTLSDKEHKETLKFSVKVANGRVPIIAGTGSNDTAYAIELTKYACEVGCDAMLVVTPYYNKATQKGLVEMYSAIADASTKPIIVYNVPSRTGVNIEPDTYVALSKIKNIVAVKEANGNISKIADEMSKARTLAYYSGNDDQIVPIMSLGGKGVISVLSNVLPKQTMQICNLCKNGDYAGASKLQLDLLPLINALFCEVNPIPVKQAMYSMGFCDKHLRLPLTWMEKEHAEKLIALMKEQGVKIVND